MFWNRDKKKKLKVGIALGGGGAKGFALLGAVKALREMGVVPDAIAGTSAGAIAGAFLASGMSPDETFGLLKINGFFKYSKVSIPKNGFMSLEGLKKQLDTALGQIDIQDLPIPFFATVTNLNEGKVAYLNHGPLTLAVLASASIPVLFSPVEINGMSYVDGGVLDNLPITPLKACCRKTVAISISPIQQIDKIEGLVKVATRVFQLTVNAEKDWVRDNCDLFIEPAGIEKYDLLDASHAGELFEAGYRHTLAMDIPSNLKTAT